MGRWCAVAFALAQTAELRAAEPRPTATDVAASQALFERARRLLADHRAEEACPLFEESLRLEAGLGTQFNLAVCYEATGRFASAYTLFLEVAAGARSRGQGPRARVARERAAAVEAKVSRLVIEVEPGQHGAVTVQRNGSVVGAPQWGLAMPLDAGSYRVAASGPGLVPWSREVTVGVASAVVVVRVPLLAREAPPTAAPSVAAPSVAAPSVAAPSVAVPPVVTPSVPQVTAPRHDQEPGDEEPGPGAPRPRELAAACDAPGGLGCGPPSAAVALGEPEGFFAPPLRKVGLAALGVGAVGLTAGTVFALRAQSKNEDSESRGCDNRNCPDRASLALRQQALTAGDRATIGFGIGVAGVAAAGILFWALPQPSSGTTSAGLLPVLPTFGPHGGGLTLQGDF
jgi:hypothetical protein